MSLPVKGFQGEYRFLSNFWASPFQPDPDDQHINAIWPTVEHAYQAAKCVWEDDKNKIFNAKTPSEAKRLGRKVEIRPNFDSMKLRIMEHLVRQKFFQNEDLAQKLIDTGDSYLEETNNWKDTFWGVCNGVGLNNLGLILMKIRCELSMR